MQFFTGIEIDGSSLGTHAGPPYEQAVSRILYDISFAGQVGRAVLRPFRDRELARPLRIVPGNRPDTVPNIDPAATEQAFIAQAANVVPAGVPIVDRGEILAIGAGGGLHALMHFSPDRLHAHGPGVRADQVLVHELVHAIRFIRGRNLTYRLAHHFDNWEEFFATLVENIYLSEHHRPLRADHRRHSHTSHAGHNFGAFAMRPGHGGPAARNVLDLEIDNLIEQFIRSDPALSADLAAVPSHFNPIRERLLHA
jgi:hypothetical protein